MNGGLGFWAAIAEHRAADGQGMVVARIRPGIRDAWELFIRVTELELTAGVLKKKLSKIQTYTERRKAVVSTNSIMLGFAAFPAIPPRSVK